MRSILPWKKNRTENLPSLWDDSWFDTSWEHALEKFFAPSTNLSRLPQVDVTDDKNEVKVRAELPGLTQKEIKLTWQNGILRIQGEKREETNDTSKGIHYSESRFGSFTRDINLGKSVDWEHAKAAYSNGVLTVTVPKSENARRAIDIHID